MYSAKLCSLFALGAIACGSGSSGAVTVTLSNTTFGTTGGNLYNCGSPARPSNIHSVNGSFGCSLSQNADGSYSTTPVTETKRLGCSDGHGAWLVMTCAGTGAPHEVSGSVTLDLTSSCDAPSMAGGDMLTFDKVAPGTPQMKGLQDCAVFSSFCPSSNACAFNQLKADVSVTAN
jgi:hypothetical protein